MEKEGMRTTVEDKKGNVKIIRQMTRVKGKTKKLFDGKIHSFSYAC